VGELGHGEGRGEGGAARAEKIKRRSGGESVHGFGEAGAEGGGLGWGEEQGVCRAGVEGGGVTVGLA